MTPGPSLDAVRRGLGRVRSRIVEAGGDPDAVRIVAVTKGFGVEAVTAALSAGVADIGENYAQELIGKARELEVVAGPRVRWHFLGAIQRNKVASLGPLTFLWQSVARVVEGEAIARRSPGARVLVEVDSTGQLGRNGCPPPEVPPLVRSLQSLALDVRGLMTVAPVGVEARQAFRTVRELADALSLPERSMGMSDDLEAAVMEGSTMVRLGRALFGDRPLRTARAAPTGTPASVEAP